MHSLLMDIGIAIIVATIIGIATYRFKQPIILGYLIAGALIGPEIGLKLITHPDNIEIISEIGLVLLLFIIGLEMNIPKIITSGKQVIIAGLGQYVLCVLLGLGFFSLLGYSLSGKNISGLYLALLCAISSTAVVVKLLYDKFELDTLSGRITLGVLIIQDIWAILILAFQPNFHDPHLSFFAVAILKTIALLGFSFLLSKYVLRFIYEFISKSPEMVVVMSIGWCAFVAAAAEYIGLSKEMGALIAGLSISLFPYSLHVTAKILPLRDFFLTLFFISLGMKILLPPFSHIFIVLGMVVFVIASRLLTVLPLLLLAGSGRRTGVITSLNLSQISEFSLVIAALGVSYGHIGKDIMLLVIYAMAITCIISSYFIKFNHEIYLYMARIMDRFGIKTKEAEKVEENEEEKSHSIVILGFHRGARALVEIISAQKPDLLKQIIVVDFNIEILNELKEMNIAGVFGDISSVDTLKHAHIENAKLILSTIPDMLLKGTNNLKLIKTCRALAPKTTIVATADSTTHVKELIVAGANEVIVPYSLAGEHLARYVMNFQPTN